MGMLRRYIAQDRGRCKRRGREGGVWVGWLVEEIHDT